MATDAARQGERRAAGAVVATTQQGQAGDRAAAGAVLWAAEQVEDGFDGDL